MEDSGRVAALPWRVAALALLAGAALSGAGALLVGLARGPILAAFLWTSALALLAPAVGLLLLSVVVHRRGAPPRGAAEVVAACAGAWAGGCLWALADAPLRLPWPPTALGTLLNLAMLVASPLAAWHDRPEGLLYLGGGALAGLGATWAGWHRRRRG